jgi:hypothetical protein
MGEENEENRHTLNLKAGGEGENSPPAQNILYTPEFFCSNNYVEFINVASFAGF